MRLYKIIPTTLLSLTIFLSIPQLAFGSGADQADDPRYTGAESAAAAPGAIVRAASRVAGGGTRSPYEEAELRDAQEAALVFVFRELKSQAAHGGAGKVSNPGDGDTEEDLIPEEKNAKGETLRLGQLLVFVLGLQEMRGLIFQQLHLELRPEKTFMGYATKGFDFLGYRIQQVCSKNPGSKIQLGSSQNRTSARVPVKYNKDCITKTPTLPGKRITTSTPQALVDQESREPDLRVAISLNNATLERFRKKRTWLYEQKATPDRLGAYTRKFEQWATGGFKGIAEVNFHRDLIYTSSG